MRDGMSLALGGESHRMHPLRSLVPLILLGVCLASFEPSLVRAQFVRASGEPARGDTPTIDTRLLRPYASVRVGDVSRLYVHGRFVTCLRRIDTTTRCTTGRIPSLRLSRKVIGFGVALSLAGALFTFVSFSSLFYADSESGRDTEHGLAIAAIIYDVVGAGAIATGTALSVRSHRAIRRLAGPTVSVAPQLVLGREESSFGLGIVGSF